MASDGRRGPSEATEPDSSGVVELLLPRPCQRLVSSRRPPRAAPAPSVAAWEAQAAEPGDVTLPHPVPPRGAGPGLLERPHEELPMGEGMSSCPRAGCGKTARPVR